MCYEYTNAGRRTVHYADPVIFFAEAADGRSVLRDDVFAGAVRYDPVRVPGYRIRGRDRI